MSNPGATTHFLHSLNRLDHFRQGMAARLSNIALTLEQTEQAEKIASGPLYLQQEITDLRATSQRLEQGVFRLLVLGDMKRGKSTFLNALIGENLLPSDVNPCTAVLTVLQYGSDKRVTVHYRGGKTPEQLDFSDFKLRYTINSAEAKQLEQQGQRAFPEVSHAVITYPLPLLERGVEIVDSPGLNDTEARNQLSLGFIQNCHVILFVLTATQLCTLAERRYLDHYIKGRGLSVFFLINAWDQIQESLLDPEDPVELAAATQKLHRVLRANLQDYCQVDGFDLYDQRVFPVSALQALRQRLRDPEASLDQTGFPPFLAALNTFLTQERGVAELRQARNLARQVLHHTREATARRIPLLDQDLAELKQRIADVEPEFLALTQIGNQLKQDIENLRDLKSRTLAESFRSYVLAMATTFDQEFLPYQPPDLELLDLLNPDHRQRFNLAFQAAFEQYVNDQFAVWTRTAQGDLQQAFQQLAQRAQRYGSSYQVVTDRIAEALTGQTLPRDPLKDGSADDSPGWAQWAMGLLSLKTGHLSSAAPAMTGFDFQAGLLNLFTSLGISMLASSIFGVILGPVTLALLGLGIGALQADYARKQLTQVTKGEFVKVLPQIAQEQYQPIYNAVQDCFDTYKQEVMQRLNQDIQGRQAELAELLKHRTAREIDYHTEVSRLRILEAQVASDCEVIEQLYQTLLETV
ncbi:MAG: dynamin [Acaryochloridaceae cyanobacterium SU_2_1]|nr:dynamin [Acaryochloridaceae cyanobacterium SU_2_1]